MTKIIGRKPRPRKGFVQTILLLLACVSMLGQGVQAHASSKLRVVVGLEEPLVPTGPTTAREDKALDAAVRVFVEASASHDDFARSAAPFNEFLRKHPESAWRTALLTNLGVGYYRAGYFSYALDSWQRAWEAGRSAVTQEAKALTDRAVGELARMHARVGNAAELEKLLQQIGDRPISGPATEMVAGAREGLWMFRNEPGVSYLCGPKALRNVLQALDADAEKIQHVDEARSGPNGFTLEQVAKLADESGLSHRLVQRAVGQPVPVPSIVHWKVRHYAAIVAERDGRYRIQDPTFGGGDLWVTRAAIDAESSGFFLVPAAAMQSHGASSWRLASLDAARQVVGMGFTGVNQPGSTTPDDARKDDSDCSFGMCVANAHLMQVSLNLNDTPVGYQPAVGPAVRVRLTYNQREANQPANFSFFNVGAKWTVNFLSYVQDNPSFPGQSVIRYVAGGGAIDYSSSYGYSSATGEFTPDRQGQAVLVRIPATGPATSYELRMPDGSKLVFAHSDGATTMPRRMFMTQVVDPASNALTLNYDSQRRLVSITDAVGRNTVFSYGLPSNPLQVTRITDPFGRHADIGYDGGGRLSSITDVLGMVSSFEYDTAGLVNAMTTPYGRSTFSFGQGANNSRFLEMTDPMGFTERLEFAHVAPGIPLSDPVAPAGIGVQNIYLYYRNTFHWDKHLYPITHTDYTRAHITHWLHNLAGQTSPIVESIKAPLERRIWKTYLAQGSTYFEGLNDKPTAIGRVMDDGTTQAIRFSYNNRGKPVVSIDPLGRTGVYTYAANGIDLLTVQKQTSPTAASTVATFTYNNQHLPLTATDAAGQVTRYTYNAAGQVTSVTNPLAEVAGYGYDSFGRLTTVTNANGVAQHTFTYDAFDRIATHTDSEGYALTYAYDNLDRPTRITYPDGTATLYSYDRLDLASVTDRLGHVTAYTRDANRRLTSVTDALGQTTRYGYYNNGVLRTLTDPNGNVTTWEVDIQGRPIAKRYADGRTQALTYEASTSRLRSSTDALGQVRTYAYFNDDELRSISYANTVNPTPGVSFAYDPYFSRVTSMTDGIGTTSYQYRPIGSLGALQLAVEDGPYNNDTVSYQYDAVGRVNQRTVDSSSETFAYDTIGRAISHATPLGAFAMTYLGQSDQPLSRQSATVSTQWGYEANAGDRRLRSVSNNGAARSFVYAATPENLISSVTESIGLTQLQRWNYTYDAADRLLSAQPLTGARHEYAYDATGNLTSILNNSGNAVASYNSVNQLTSLNGVARVYDANGNLTDDGARTYRWDADNRLVGISYRSTPSLTTTFRYDGLGRRLAIVNTTGTTASEIRHLWCGESLCQARTASDVVSRRYYPEGEFIPAGGTQLYYGTDHLGSVRDVLAAQTGSKVASYDYDSYGNLISVSGRVSTDMRYAGMFFHPQSGLYLTNFRAYDPRAGRWLSRDPIAETGGINLYAYVAGNPVKYTDPTGQIPLDTIWDALNVAYDLWTGNECDLAMDLAAMMIPYVPAGVSKLRHLDEAADAAGDLARQIRREEQATGAARTTTDIVSTPNGLVNVRQTIDRIEAGGTHPHRHDGSVFRNDEGLLPNQPRDYYREYVHPTPGLNHAGQQRIIRGQGGELYYSPDHYGTFIPLN